MTGEAPPPATKREGLPALTEREKEALRLLLAGHDAKSSARHLHLSVHTVNERLRDARRKLGVSSSREAARLLAAAGQGGPNPLGDKQLGVGEGPPGVLDQEPAGPRQRAGHRLAWLGGGMLIMSLIIAAAMFAAVLHGGGAEPADGTRAAFPMGSAPTAADAPAIASARAWLALLDGGDWEGSWRTAAAPFKSRIPAAQWAGMARAVRQPLGPVSSRTVQSVAKAASLPGAPAGDYRIVEWRTDFAGKAGAVETVVLAREGGDWRVAGYFIR